MKSLKTLWQFIKSLFPRLNRAQRRKFWHAQRRVGSLLKRYHALWQKRPQGTGWWVRARRVALSG